MHFVHTGYENQRTNNLGTPAATHRRMHALENTLQELACVHSGTSSTGTGGPAAAPGSKNNSRTLETTAEYTDAVV